MGSVFELGTGSGLLLRWRLERWLETWLGRRFGCLLGMGKRTEMLSGSRCW